MHSLVEEAVLMITRLTWMILKNCSHWEQSPEPSLLLLCCAPVSTARKATLFPAWCCIVSSLIVYLHIFSPCIVPRICICIYTFMLILTLIFILTWVMCAKVAAALFDARIVVLPFDFCRQFTHTFYLFQYCCFSPPLLLLRSENLFCC